MPSKKAAKKSAKKIAKQAAKHTSFNDLRRAYEHLGRIEILEGALAGAPFRDVSDLAELAQQELACGHAEFAAGLLRAAEHLSFAALAPKTIYAEDISLDLEDAVAAEFDHLTRRAEDHWAESRPRPLILTALYARILKQARAALSTTAYRPALELARAAEALSHVTISDHNARLPAASLQSRQLAS